MVKNITKAFSFLLVLGLFFPIALSMPLATADGSWVMVMNHAITQHWIFGRDINYNYGFFAYLGTFLYDPILFPYLMLFWFCFSVTFLVYLYALFLGETKYWSKLLMTLVFLTAVIAYGGNVFFPVYILVFGWYALKQDKFFDFWSLCGSGLLAIVTLIKFSYGLFALLLILGLALFDIKNKRLPLGILCYSCVFLLAFFLNHQPLAYFWDFVRGVVQINVGYNGALSLGGTRFFPVLVYIILAVCLCRFFAKIQYYSSKSTNRAAVFLLAFSFFSIFKSSFIRADTHIFLAFAYELDVILLLIIFYFTKSAATWADVFKRRGIILLMMMAVILAIVCRVNILPNPVNSVRNFLAYGHLAEEYQDTLQNIRAEYPLPKVRGTADIYSLDQTVLLANNISYDPRPVFQSDSAYTPEILIANRDHLLAKNAPDNVFFKLQPMDNRYPSLEDGLSWPVLLSHYSLKQSLANYLWLVKRDSMTDVNIMSVTQKTYKVGDLVVMPSELANQYVWLKITFPNNLANTFVSALYKPVQVYITVTLLNGRTQQYRYIEGMGAAGFLLSPLVETDNEFADLYTSQGRGLLLKANQIKSFMITYHGWQRIVTPRHYQVEFAQLQFK